MNIIITNDILSEDGSTIPPFKVEDSNGSTVYVGTTYEECENFILRNQTKL